MCWWRRLLYFILPTVISHTAKYARCIVCFLYCWLALQCRFWFICLDCLECQFGMYTKKACATGTSQVYGSNTQCAPCTNCRTMEYPSRQCQLGMDTVCESCEVCSFPTESARLICNAGGRYLTWFRDNCCVGTDGKYVCFWTADYRLLRVEYSSHFVLCCIIISGWLQGRYSPANDAIIHNWKTRHCFCRNCLNNKI